jgi:membrane-bound serine protease (ClpP class)
VYSEQNELFSFSLVILLAFLVVPCGTATLTNQVLVLRIDGPITSSTAELVAEVLQAAEIRRTHAVVIQLNTLGGLLSATIDIIDKIERSPVPVVTYVSPQGARAWSAGAFILVGSHVAAMAPYTIAGSSQPVSYSPVGGSQPINDTKTINALSLFIAERARLHARNETAARAFVEHNLNLNEEAALRYRVIEVVARSIDELLFKIDGMTVETAAGKVTLRTAGSSPIQYSVGLRLLLLHVISDPLIASIALLIGMYALIFGLSALGHTAEVIGAFLLIIGLIGLGLSVNIGALLLIIVGAILMIGEAYAPTHGLLAGTGVFFVVVGSLLLIPFEASQWSISAGWYISFITVVLSAASVIGAFTIFMVYKVFRARMKRPVMGELVGEKVEVIDKLGPGIVGFVKYRGEYWRARSSENIEPGTEAEIVAKEGPILIVRARVAWREVFKV